MFCFFGGCDHVAFLQPPAYLRKVHSPVQQYGNPVSPADMVSFQEALLADQHVPQDRISQFHIQNIHGLFTGQPQLCSGDIHDQAEPFLIVFMAENHIIGKTSPQVFLRYLPGLLYISDDSVSVRCHSKFLFVFLYLLKFCVPVRSSPILCRCCHGRPDPRRLPFWSCLY